MLMHWFPSKIIELTGSSSVSMMGVKRCLIGNDYSSLGFVAMNCWKDSSAQKRPPRAIMLECGCVMMCDVSVIDTRQKRSPTSFHEFLFFAMGQAIIKSTSSITHQFICLCKALKPGQNKYSTHLKLIAV
jgi:hypothetical protein